MRVGSIDSMFSVYIQDPLVHRPDAVGAPALMCDDFPLGELPQRHAVDSIVETAEIGKGSSRDDNNSVKCEVANM